MDSNITDLSIDPINNANKSILNILSWEGGVLFAGFVMITLVWELGTAFLAFVTIYFSGRKAIWLQRLKTEVLALGIITLVLTILTSLLTSICIPGQSQEAGRRRLHHLHYPTHTQNGQRDLLEASTTTTTATSGEISSTCPSGQHQLFTMAIIEETHLLLFETAIMHIVVTCTTFYLTLLRMRYWKEWEKRARTDRQLPMDSSSLRLQLGSNGYHHALNSIKGAFNSLVTEPLYNLLRILCKIRIDDAALSPEDRLPAQFNFLNIVEQGMEVEFSQASEQSVVLLVFMAGFMSIPRTESQIGEQIYILSLCSTAAMLLASAKYQSIAVHLASIALCDFQEEIKTQRRAQMMFLNSVRARSTIRRRGSATEGDSSMMKETLLARTSGSHHGSVKIERGSADLLTGSEGGLSSKGRHHHAIAARLESVVSTPTGAGGEGGAMSGRHRLHVLLADSEALTSPPKSCHAEKLRWGKAEVMGAAGVEGMDTSNSRGVWKLKGGENSNGSSRLHNAAPRQSGSLRIKAMEISSEAQRGTHADAGSIAAAAAAASASLLSAMSGQTSSSAAAAAATDVDVRAASRLIRFLTSREQRDTGVAFKSSNGLTFQEPSCLVSQASVDDCGHSTPHWVTLPPVQFPQAPGSTQNAMPAAAGAVSLVELQRSRSLLSQEDPLQTNSGGIIRKGVLKSNQVAPEPLSSTTVVSSGMPLGEDTVDPAVILSSAAKEDDAIFVHQLHEGPGHNAESSMKTEAVPEGVLYSINSNPPKFCRDEASTPDTHDPEEHQPHLEGLCRDQVSIPYSGLSSSTQPLIAAMSKEYVSVSLQPPVPEVMTSSREGNALSVVVSSLINARHSPDVRLGEEHIKAVHYGACTAVSVDSHRLDVGVNHVLHENGNIDHISPAGSQHHDQRRALERILSVASEAYSDANGMLLEEDEDQDVNIEAMRPRLRAHFRSNEDLEGGETLLRDAGKTLFWFNTPWVLSWLYNLSMMGTMLALMFIVYGALTGGTAFVRSQNAVLMSLIIVLDIGTIIYASFRVQPVAALVGTVSTLYPARLIRQIKKQKIVDEEAYEEGLGGRMFKCFMCRPSQSDDEEEGEGKDVRDQEAVKEFMHMLADQAGVIATDRGPSGSESHRLAALQLHERFIEMWMKRAEDWKAKIKDQVYSVKCDLDLMLRAFQMIDTSGDGAISSAELAVVLREMGTRATAEELEDMVNEIDIDGTDRIEFKEFVFFLVFKYFDADNDGYLSEDDVKKTIMHLKLDQYHSVEAMARLLIKFCKHMRRTTKKKLIAHPGIHLADFINMFLGTRLLDLNDQEHCPAEEAAVPPVDQAQSSGSFLFPGSSFSSSFSYARMMLAKRSLASVGLAVRGMLTGRAAMKKSFPHKTIISSSGSSSKDLQLMQGPASSHHSMTMQSADMHGPASSHHSMTVQSADMPQQSSVTVYAAHMQESAASMTDTKSDEVLGGARSEECEKVTGGIDLTAATLVGR
ncbi:hypothetical protein CEUSTIGMA_g12270.t1 [Chlamydomonas eustigma]|uniref:EF-hand domain-containing protein n=1 Tax=Chlamydomonas eustigma TaxID=1157962 RepID=A0A250XPH4_9CHLO|nr:hypothetical protein CEUSTIGMA_g12270.t1 [Chlamydomonas eustigma]|eukprot:GAX84849.1 hypothetical protein CEUSTIGMA_g12270.t1 [Chlamydomonas eustigma]